MKRLLRRVPLLVRVSIALTVVAVLPLAYAVFSLFEINRAGMNEQVLRTHAVAASTAAERIAGIIDSRQALARSIAANEPVTADPRAEESGRFLREVLAADASIEIVEITTPAGEIVIRVQRHGAGERVGVIPGNAPAVWNKYLVVAELLEDGRGTLRVIADAAGVADALRPTEIGEHAEMILASRDDRKTVSSFPPAMVAAARNARVNGTGIYRDAHGKQIVGAFAPVNGTPWFVMSRQPAVIAQKISIAMRRRATTAAVAAILLAALLIVAAERSVIRPIREVVRAQQHLAAATPIPAGNEIEQLIAASESIHRRIADQEELGRVFLGRYQVLSIIGQGGMGTVFRGWDPKLRRHIALKTVHLGSLTGHNDTVGLIESLLAEAIIVASVSHPNIVAVYDVEDSAGAAFMAMELIDGVSLQAYLDQRGALAPEQAILLGLGVARGLEAAHARGILHQDIKPANVLLSFDGAIKVADFGLAALVNDRSAIDMVFGTPGYIAPEAATGKGRDARSDLFSLGVLMYQAATGANPFEREGARETMIASVTTKPRPLIEVLHGDAARSALADALSEMVEALMQKLPADRPGTAAEVVARLQMLTQLHRLQWKIDAEDKGTLLRSGRGSATLVPTLSLERTVTR